MDGYDKSVMVALLPTTVDWCHIALPHLTVVYVGEKADLRPSIYNELAKDAVSVAQTYEEVDLQVNRVRTFGGGRDPFVDALTFEPTPTLLQIRKKFERWNGSEFPFNPHATIGPVGSAQKIPDSVLFDRISVCWGREMVTYLLRQPTR